MTRILQSTDFMVYYVHILNQRFGEVVILKFIESNWLMENCNGFMVNGPKSVIQKTYVSMSIRDFLPVINRTYMMVYDLY